MAAVGAEVTGAWFLSSGAVGFFILLLVLSVFLAALCSNCNRRSFELRDSREDKNPSALITVVKLEDTMMARENPTISEIRSDEKDVQTNGGASVMETGGDSNAAGESNPGEENSVQFMLWRSHLGASQKQDGDGLGGGRSNADVSSPPTNHEPAVLDSNDRDRNSVYAQVSKKGRRATPPVHTPEVAQVEEEESSPPLPVRTTEMEG
ncbi:uncharacterized protein si:ch73-204p21.2 [Xiphias gladius]|uniref:uncharacterized protein si:ch73-204p21.2 n=1 Tax=Xiphias gladius TaxID=8245 RepID=UPI001A9A2AFF|nr:uncharacterized protein si:ch73-204p21.2 [Xiphias gladius]XP_039994197.1 uncharacterized protein si:ch73-204p21.2 [Xiphias gladius]XP_039994207.1 uncharacterized protein si:ch73-204p21.2 [Xiphias gladius]